MKSKNESGAIILESTYCIILAIIVIMFFISFGFFLYQKTMVSIVTNEVAQQVSTNYKLLNVADNSNITSEDIVGVGKYRYLFFAKDFNKKNEEKAKNFVDLRLSKTSLAQDEGGLSVDIKTVVDDIGRRHYDITVEQKYSFLLGELLNVIGQREEQSFKATARVEGMDVLSYVNTVRMTKYGIKKIEENSDILGLLNNAIKLLHSIVTDFGK